MPRISILQLGSFHQYIEKVLLGGTHPRVFALHKVNPIHHLTITNLWLQEQLLKSKSQHAGLVTLTVRSMVVVATILTGTKRVLPCLPIQPDQKIASDLIFN